MAGAMDEAEEMLSQALRQNDDLGERIWEPELYRLRGNLHLLGTNPDPGAAESSFMRAIEVARGQHTKSWELRAATSLARLWQGQGKTREAHDLLAPVHGWFTEGFDTADLKGAKALLDALG